MRTQTIDPSHSRYPEGVREVPGIARFCKGNPPPLYLRGQLPTGPSVSVIGSREVPRAASICAEDLARTLSRAGWWVVSGGAKGVDAAAHRGALRAGGPTFAVLTGGLDRPAYPPVHADLFAEILAAGGGLLSLEADGMQRHRYQFLQRNVVMTAMTSATVVVHARRGGGAISAARSAEALGRPVFFLSASPWETTGGGNLDALSAGARPLWSIADAVATLAPFASPSPQGLDDDQRRLWRVLSHEPLHVDLVRQRATLSRERTAEALLLLVLDGHIEEGPSAHYRRRRCL